MNSQKPTDNHMTQYSKALAIILAIFFGGLGIHKFYQGRIATGFIYLLLCWTFVPTILSIIDAIVIACTPSEQCIRKTNI